LNNTALFIENYLKQILKENKGFKFYQTLEIAFKKMKYDECKDLISFDYKEAFSIVKQPLLQMVIK